jgi:hypothetical protein
VKAAAPWERGGAELPVRGDRAVDERELAGNAPAPEDDRVRACAQDAPEVAVAVDEVITGSDLRHNLIFE